MNHDHDEYQLGADVTSQARSKERRNTGVLSVRLPTSDIVAIETASEACGKTTAQVVREAIAAYLPTLGFILNQPSITITWGEGQSISTGPARSPNRASQSDSRRWSPDTVPAG
jgi:predicted DNA-binding protein